jgi:phosphate ABC transporter permease protein PstC
MKERVIERGLQLTAFSAIFVLALITFFIFREGLPLLTRVGAWKFISGTKWYPTKELYGILPMIVGSLAVTGGSLLFGIPLGLGAAVYLGEFSSRRTRVILKPAVELLAGIPSVVYGFLGVILLVPLIREYLGGPGLSILASSLILGIMILPTIIGISLDAIQAVPGAYREGALALGATRWQTTRRVVLPAARSGILAGIILGMGRAVGETMAVIMVAGNALKITIWPLDSVRTLTSNIALEMGYATGDHRLALFATGLVLFVIIAILNTIANLTARR